MKRKKEIESRKKLKEQKAITLIAFVVSTKCSRYF